MFNELLFRFVDFQMLDYFRKNIYSEAIFSPSDLSNEINFISYGWKLPFVALWRTAIPNYPPDTGEFMHSSMRRQFVINDRPYVGTQKTLRYTYNLTAASYKSDFINSISHWMITDFRPREHVAIDISSLIPGYVKPTIAFIAVPDEGTKEMKVSEIDGQPRQLSDSIPFTADITMPYIEEGFFIEALKVSINEHMAFYAEFD